MDSNIVFLGLLILGGGSFVGSYFVMKKVASYTNGSLRKSQETDRALDSLIPKVKSSIQNSTHVHRKIKTIVR